MTRLCPRRHVDQCTAYGQYRKNLPWRNQRGSTKGEIAVKQNTFAAASYEFHYSITVNSTSSGPLSGSDIKSALCRSPVPVRLQPAPTLEAREEAHRSTSHCLSAHKKVTQT